MTTFAPKLPREKQRELLLISRAGDRRARDKLVCSMGSFVYQCARKFVRPGVELDDLMSAGQEGLLVAIDRYDPDRGCLTTYAKYWIMAKLRECARDHEDTHISRSRDIEDRIHPAVLYAARHAERLDAPLEMGSSGSPGSISTYLDAFHSPWETPEALTSDKLDQESLHEAVAGLPTNQRRVIRERFLTEDPKTLEEISPLLDGRSKERVRQIESEALDRLRKVLSKRDRPSLKLVANVRRDWYSLKR